MAQVLYNIFSYPPPVPGLSLSPAWRTRGGHHLPLIPSLIGDNPPNSLDWKKWMILSYYHIYYPKCNWAFLEIAQEGCSVCSVKLLLSNKCLILLLSFQLSLPYGHWPMVTWVSWFERYSSNYLYWISSKQLQLKFNTEILWCCVKK